MERNLKGTHFMKKLIPTIQKIILKINDVFKT